MGWAQEEFETIDLGDERLNRRAVLLAERLGHKPGASIPAACGNWTETGAAYRFLRNEQVGWDEVLTAHAQASRSRIGQHDVVLAVPAGHHRVRLSGPDDRGVGAAELRGPAGVVSAPDLRGDARARAAMGDQRVDVGMRGYARELDVA